MESDVVCPDCGKIIAPAGSVENSSRCRCAEAALVGTATSRTSSVNGSETAQPAKTCYVCNAELTGRARLKDHLGRYWCIDCTKADERAKKREDELRCPDCSRVFPPDKLVYFQATQVCKSCYREREKELQRKILKHGIQKTEKRHEWGRIKWMALIVIGLLALATVARMMW